MWQFWPVAWSWSTSVRWGGTQIIFWRGVRPEIWNPYPYLRGFFSLKNGWFDCFFFFLLLFFWHFRKSGPISKHFSISKQLIFHFLKFLWNGTLLRIVLTKIEPLSKSFWWKSKPFGRHIHVCLNMWIPSPSPNISMARVKCTTNHLDVFCNKKCCS